MFYPEISVRYVVRAASLDGNLFCSIVQWQKEANGPFITSGEQNMTIHYPATSIDKKILIMTTLEEITNKLDSLIQATQLTHDLLGSFEIECCACAGTIRQGNACLEISRKVEQHEVCGDKHFATVIDSDSFATFCASCGNHFSNANDWRRRLIDILGLKEDVATSKLTNVCDRCQCHLSAQSKRVSVELMISQLEYFPESNDGGGFIPIMAEDILIFCSSCGDNMSTDLLNRSIAKLIHGE
jgi:hypothetical protein